MRAAMFALARGMATLGGIVLTFLILLTCISISGRLLNGMFHADWIDRIAPDFADAMINWVGPVNGDFEIVEAGVAFAIFAFIPLCQITSGHAAVDVLTNRFPAGINRVLGALIEIAFTVVLVVIAWRLAEGTGDKFRNGETSLLLEFPIWWAYAASLFGAVVAAVVAVYMAAVRIGHAVTGTDPFSVGGGIDT